MPEPDSLRLDLRDLGPRPVHAVIAADVVDRAGRLLLAAGTRLTAGHRDRLLRRGVWSIPVEAGSVAAAERSPRAGGAAATLESFHDPAISARLAAELPRRLRYLANDGPPAAAEVEPLGDFGDPGEQAGRDAAIARHVFETEEAIGDLLRALRGGEAIAGEAVEGLVAEMFAQLAGDFAGLPLLLGRMPGVASLAEALRTLATLSMAVGTQLGLTKKNVLRVGVAAVMHDAGWTRQPRSIHRAILVGPPAEQASEAGRRHIAESGRIIHRTAGLPALVGRIAAQVHERPNGSGFPNGLAGRDVHLLAEIIGLAGDYLAGLCRCGLGRETPAGLMRSLLAERPIGRRSALPLRGLLRSVGLVPGGSEVVLSDGSRATIAAAAGDAYDRPIVQRIEPAGDGEALRFLVLSETDLAIARVLRADRAEPGVPRPKHIDGVAAAKATPAE